jgi:hypothetical protein
VYNGDDSISLKGNSTDISITNSNFYNGLGIALGSIGQYNDQFETIERLTAKNINYHNTLHAVSRSHKALKSCVDIDRYTSKHGQMTKMDIHPMVAAVALDVSSPSKRHISTPLKYVS